MFSGSYEYQRRCSSANSQADSNATPETVPALWSGGRGLSEAAPEYTTAEFVTYTSASFRDGVPGQNRGTKNFVKKLSAQTKPLCSKMRSNDGVKSHSALRDLIQICKEAYLFCQCGLAQKPAMERVQAARMVEADFAER